MAITTPPTIPLITDPATFSTRAQDWVVWQAEQLYPALVEESLLLGLSLSGTSVTSNTVGTGSKSFTTQTGLGFKAGMSLSIARTAAPTNRMFAVVTSYVSGTGALVVTSQAFEGSGTFTDWSIAPSFNGVIATSQIADLAVTNAKLAQAYINDLTVVTALPTDYIPIADVSDSGNKKKALISDIITPLASSAEYNTGTNATKAISPLVARTNNVLLATSQPLTSGTFKDFTIPSWAKKIKGNISLSSTSGTSIHIVQLGDAGGIETTAYDGTAVAVVGSPGVFAMSTGFAFSNAIAATYVFNGSFELNLIDPATNTWAFTGMLGNSDSARCNISAGTKTLSQALTTIRYTTVNGTDTFDGVAASLINLNYE